MSEDKLLDDCVKKLKKFIKETILPRKEKNLAAILDIDETLILTTEDYLVQDKTNLSKFNVFYKTEAVQGMVDIYKMLLDAGITVYLLTGRPEDIRETTEDELEQHGFYKKNGYAELFMRKNKPNPLDEKTCVCFYKEKVRMDITNALKKHIILNVGDQNTDLLGGYYEYGWKFPSSYKADCKHVLDLSKPSTTTTTTGVII